MSHQTYAESIKSSHRRTVLIEILSEAACRLSGISVNPQMGPDKGSKSAKPSCFSFHYPFNQIGSIADYYLQPPLGYPCEAFALYLTEGFRRHSYLLQK